MSGTLNKVILIGRLGADPEIKYTNSGIAVGNFNIATNETWTDKITTQKQEKTEWHRIVCWNKLAEIVGQYMKKGQVVYVEGRIQSREYEADGGIKKKVYEIVASEVKMLGSKS